MAKATKSAAVPAAPPVAPKDRAKIDAAVAAAIGAAGSSGITITGPTSAAMVKPHACPRCAGKCILVSEKKWAFNGKAHKFVRAFRCEKCARLNSKTVIE